LRIRVIRLALKLIASILYVTRVILDKGPDFANCYDCPIAVANNNSSQASTPIPFTNSPYFNPTAFPVNKGPINW
ncbi:hypothetical protein B4U79_15092, partial [Dinothrombium tinctorium]